MLATQPASAPMMIHRMMLSKLMSASIGWFLLGLVLHERIRSGDFGRLFCRTTKAITTFS
ncbi:MAG TPA: hypothetical protein PLF42_10100, partial [Anaerolineales bacterium]|nr:hypothetical protein [Anaerolineales bacterium]